MRYPIPLGDARSDKTAQKTRRRCPERKTTPIEGDGDWSAVPTLKPKACQVSTYRKTLISPGNAHPSTRREHLAVTGVTEGCSDSRHEAEGFCSLLRACRIHPIHHRTARVASFRQVSPTYLPRRQGNTRSLPRAFCQCGSGPVVAALRVMRTNEASISRKRVATMTSLGLLAVLAGGACGGEPLARSTTPDAGSDHETGALGIVVEPASNPEAGAAREKAEGDVVDTGPPDSPIGVPTYHRGGESQCATPRAAGSCTPGNAGDLFLCSSDSDCTEGGANGRCTSSGGGPAGCSCTYDTCQTDADCGKGELCVCHGSAYSYGGSSCMSGNCRVDSDCGVGEYCSPAHGTSGCGYVSGYYCHTQKDECTNDSDCASGLCTWSTASERWECQEGGFCN
jgi:hypothetical protein